MTTHKCVGPLSSCVVNVQMVCEDHHDQDFEHEGCGGAGMYCETCMIRRINALEYERVALLKVAEVAREYKCLWFDEPYDGPRVSAVESHLMEAISGLDQARKEIENAKE